MVLVCLFIGAQVYASSTQACYNSANKYYSLAKAAAESAGGAGAGMAASTATATNSAGGAGQVGAGGAMSAGASASYADCSASARKAAKTATKCFNQAKSENDMQAAKASATLSENAQELMNYCSSRSANYASNSGNMNQAMMAMMMMNSLNGMAGSDGGGGAQPIVPFGGGFTPDGAEEVIEGPPVYTSRNERNDGDEELDGLPEYNLGEEEELIAEEEEKLSGERALVKEAIGAEISDEEAVKLSKNASPVELALARLNQGEATLEDVGLAPLDLGAFDLGAFGDNDPLPPEFATELGFMGAKKVKDLPPAVINVIRKKLAKYQRSIAMERAKKKVEALKIDPKSCSERNWKGSQCQSLKNDPLLNIN